MSYAVLPLPPLQSTVSSAVEVTVTTVMATLVLAALIFAAVSWRSSGRPTVLMLFLSGGAMMVLEPFVDVGGACWHPSDLARVFTLWERPMPVWLCLTYFVYFGIGGGLSWLALRRATTRRVLWGIFIAAILADTVMENVLMNWDLYVYYGHQPLRVLNFPLWWAPINSLINVAVAAAVIRYDRSLRGVRQVLIIPLAVGISLAVNSIVGFTSWTAINSGFIGIGLQLSGLATFGVAFVLMQLIVGAMVSPTQAAADADTTGDRGSAALTTARGE